jgi:hypothetical protein
MAFTSLADRINERPLLLCGPILRRVEPDSVTVWVALKEEKKVWLEVYEDISGSGSPPNLKKILSGERKTIRLGNFLHITAVTANLVSGQAAMTSGKIYYYNLFFTAGNATGASSGDPNLETPGMTPFEIHYAHEPEDLEPHNLHVHLPSFCLAPDDLNLVRIVHGSCRKVHSEGIDAMPGVDDMILSDRFDPNKRPHYLLLTGDQFYADDISPIMLYLLMDAEKSLLGTVEDLPEIGKPVLPDAEGKNAHFFRGDRKDKGGFTSHESNHLATAGEYMTYYLFMWSDIVWHGNQDGDFPSLTVVGSFFRDYNNDLVKLKRFYNGLAKVKRALANVPTYMLFDDHDVTDDWYMTYEWCEKTLSNDLGRRMLGNGLLSYAMFQGWGNTPDLYAEQDASGNKPKGKLLLEAAEAWFIHNTKRDNISSTTDNEHALQKFLGIPSNKAKPLVQIPGKDFFMIDQGADAIRWDYLISRKNYEIKFLDGRTKRGYPDPATADRKKQSHPDIISEQSMVEQFDHDDPLLPPKEVALVVAPTSLVSIPAIELDNFPWFIRWLAKSEFKKDVYEYDVYDHWRSQSRAVEKFMLMLAERNTQLFVEPGEKKQSRVVVMTGDVHFAAASRMEYENDKNRTLFAQVISSSFLKQDIKTRLLHQRGYRFISISALAFGKAFLTVFPQKLADKSWYGPVLATILFIPLILTHIAFVLLDRLLQILDQTILKNFFDPKGQEPRHYLGWTDPNQEGIDRLFILVGEDDRKEEMKLAIPAVIDKRVLEEALEPKLKFPNWQYRIDFISAENDIREAAPYPTEPLTAPGPGDRKEALKGYLSLAQNHLDYSKKWGNGKEIVGVNNISELFFEWNDTQKTVRQETWWRLKGSEGELKLFPLSNFKVPLNFNDPKFPLPAMPQAPN